MKSISPISRKPLASNQQGSALVLGIFVLVVLSLLMMSLSRLVADSQRNVAWEVLGTRATLAAESSLEAGLYDLLTGIDADSPTYACPSGVGWTLDGESSSRSFTFDIDGLVNCSSELSCLAPFYVDELGQWFYQLEAVASCGSGEVIVEREIHTQLKSSI